MRDMAVMNCWCNASCILLHIQSSVSCDSTSNYIMSESLMLKSLKVICFTKSGNRKDLKCVVRRCLWSVSIYSHVRTLLRKYCTVLFY